MTHQFKSLPLLVAIALVITLGLAALPAHIALGACPTALSLTLLNDPYLLVDSNNPVSGPQVTVAHATITNTGAATAYDVYMYVGNGITPGTFAVGSDGQKLSMLGSVADATRFIVNLAPGQSKTVYWMLKYPLTNGKTYPMTIWASNADGCSVQGSHTYTTQSTISASANKMLGTVTLDPADGQVHVGNILTLTVTGFNFGVIGQSGDAWLQPAGNLDFNPDQFRLIKTEVNIHSIAGVCGYGSMPVYDRLYFPGIRTCYSFNAADYVKYYFVPISEGTTTAKIYQQAASGASGIEKYSGDYGKSGATVTLTAHCGGITLWKSVNPQTATANTLLTWTITYRNDSGLPIGDPGTGNGLTVREDAIPANTTYEPGSATCSGSCIIYYSTDNGVTWTTTEPAPSLLTRIKWFINQVIPAGSTGTVSFQSRVNSGVSGAPLICNSASAGVGDCPFAPTDTVCANGGADLDLIKVVNNHSPCEGAQITYTVTVSNPSTTSGTGVQVTDLLPSGLTFVSSSTSQGTYSSVTGVWSVGSLSPSANATLALTARVNAGTGGTTIINWASITHADQTDPVASNNLDHDGITVHAAVAAYPASNSPVCDGATIYLYGGPGGMTSYHWDGPSFSSDLQNPTRPGATLAMAGNYTLTVISPDGCSDTVSTYVTVQPCATPPDTPTNISPSPATCVSLPVTLTASAFSDPGSGEYQAAAQWQIRASTGGYSDPVFDSETDTVNLNHITIPLGILSDSSSYCWHVRYQDNLGIWSNYSSETCFYTKPVALAYSNTPVCVGSTIQLYGGPSDMAYNWTGPLGFNSDLQRPTIGGATLGMAGNYILTVTAPNGCSDTETIYVTVVSCASPPDTPTNISPSPATCVGLPVTLTASAFFDPGGYQIAAQWQIRAGGGGYSDPVFDSGTDMVHLNSIAIPAGILSDASSYFWHVRYQDNLGAWSEYSSETFFFTKPVATASSNSPVCVNQTIQLYGGPSGMAIYSWAGPNGFSSSLQNPTIPNATTLNAGTYNLTVTALNGCSDTASTPVTVQTCATPPHRPTNISPSPGTCVGLPVALTASAFSDPGSGEYQVAAQWQIRASTGSYSAPVFDSLTDMVHLTSITIPIGILSDSSSYYWHVRYQGNLGAWSEYSSETFFCTNPVAAASSGPPAYVGGIIQLFGGPDGMTSYSWTGPNGFSSGLQNPVIPNATLAMAGTYTLTVTTVNDCTDIASISVTVGASGPYGPVGWETRPIDKVRVLLPWIVLVAAVIVAVSLLVLRHRRV